MNDKFVITIGREYGSGGGEIGRQLSKYFDIPCYDKELLTIVAKESGYCKEYFEKFDEKPLKVLSYFLGMMQILVHYLLIINYF